MKLTGVLDGDRVVGLWAERATLFAEGRLELDEIRDVDSAGLAFLVKWAKARDAAGDRLKLTGVSPRLRNLLSLYAVEPLFDLP